MNDNRSNQLKAVESKATKLLRFLDEDHNFDLPTSFPTEQVQDIARGMGKVSQSLPDKLEKALDYATKRLTDVRLEHVPFNDELGYGRNSYFDDLIAALITEIGTARGMYAKPDDQLERQTPEADVELGEEARGRAEALVGESEALSERFGITIPEARNLVDELGLVDAEEMLQSLTTGDILNDLSRAELRDKPRPGWLESLSQEVEAMPSRIVEAGAKAQVGEGVEKLGEAVEKLNQWRKDPLGQIAAGLKAIGRKMREEAVALDSAVADDDAKYVASKVPPFDLEKIREDLIRGIPPHPAHVPDITELSLEGEESLSDLSAFSDLTALIDLNLIGTGVSDSSLEKLGTLRDLRFLRLMNTTVSDEGAYHISKLKNLVFLDLDDTHITDLGLVEICRINGLESLYLSGTHISDDGLEKIGRLENLIYLSLSRISISEIGLDNIVKLEELRNLALFGTGIVYSPSVEKLIDKGVTVSGYPNTEADN